MCPRSYCWPVDIVRDAPNARLIPIQNLGLVRASLLHANGTEVTPDLHNHNELPSTVNGPRARAQGRYDVYALDAGPGSAVSDQRRASARRPH